MLKSYVTCYILLRSYAQERIAFGKAIGEFGQTQKAIAESYAELLAGK